MKYAPRISVTDKFPLIEPLEARIAPAFVLHYIDPDGDAVTVKVSRGTLADADIVFGQNGTQLQKLGLNDPIFMGANVSITAQPSTSGGDGRADVGWLQMQFPVSGEIAPSLGRVVIDGDLGKISISGPPGQLGELIVDRDRVLPDAGRGLRSLSVGSIGLFALTTGAPDALSEIRGDVDLLAVARNVREAQFRISGHLKSLRIGGDLIGGDAEFSGSLLTGRDIRQAVIGGDLSGGAGGRSGALFSGENFGSLLVKGSLRGGAGAQFGHMDALNGNIGRVRVDGSSSGGGGLESGAISSNLIRVVLANGTDSGGDVFVNEIGEAGTNIGTVSVGGSVSGTGILCLGSLGDVQVGGSLLNARILSSHAAGAVAIAGDLTASEIYLLSADRLSVGGDVTGKSGGIGAQITVLLHLDHLSIGGDFRTDSPGALSFLTVGAGRMQTLKIGGSVDGAFIAIADLQRGTIGGDIRGGSVKNQGSFYGGTIGAFHIGGSVIAGTAEGTGDLRFGEIRGTVSIDGDVTGQSDYRVTILSVGDFGTPVGGGLTISGAVRYADVLLGYDVDGMPANSLARLANFTVHGDWMASNLAVGIKPGDDGRFGTEDDAYNQTDPTIPPPSLGRLEIGGRILGTGNAGDGFGLVAGKIGQLIIGGKIGLSRREKGTTISTSSRPATRACTRSRGLSPRRLDLPWTTCGDFSACLGDANRRRRCTASFASFRVISRTESLGFELLILTLKKRHIRGLHFKASRYLSAPFFQKTQS